VTISFPTGGPSFDWLATGAINTVIAHGDGENANLYEYGSSTGDTGLVAPENALPSVMDFCARGDADAGCTPRTCASAGANCGSLSDGCGGTLDCGTCTAPETCGGGGSANVCGTGACTPRTCASVGANCGTLSDGCGGTLDCGTCTAPKTCGGGGKANVCGPTRQTW
jgi:hypothetical protein